MSYGRLVEVGTPRDLYLHPQTEFVASFLGTANILLGQTEGERIQIGPHIFGLTKEATKFSTDGRVQVLFRPEDIALASSKEDLDCPALGEGTVTTMGFNGPSERIRLELPAIPGVRAIAPAVPFGSQSITIDASRPPEQASAFPLSVNNKAWVGIRRLHALSHPGLSFLVVTDGSLRSQSAISAGGYLARMSHARMTLLGVGKDEPLLDSYLQDARKQLGSGMASIQVRTDRSAPAIAIARAVEQNPVDLVIAGWRPLEGVAPAEQILQVGDHHLLLAAHPGARFEKALVCVASGEPGKDDVLFAGRLLRHLGAQAKLFTTLGREFKDDYQRLRVERFVGGGVKSLEMFGVPTQSEIRIGNPQEEIVEEIKRGEFDLLVMGVPLPHKGGRIVISGLIEDIIKNAGNCSILMVRSHHTKYPVYYNSTELLLAS
jgi:nucleotide-binding universal stress UspA family protein